MQITIVSGGQTGVDQAALEWALAVGYPHGGWCPLGRRAENGEIPRRFKLRETPSRSVGDRTLWNVRDSDGTAIFALTESLTSGTARTARHCVESDCPVILLAANVFTPREAGLALRHFLAKHRIRTLNVAGPRASEGDAGEFTFAVLDSAFHGREIGTPK